VLPLLPPQEQWEIRDELKRRFPDKPWLDVLSKADLLEEELEAADQQIATGSSAAAGRRPVADAVDFAAALPDAVRASSLTQHGIPQLQQAVMSMLEAAASCAGAAAADGREVSAEFHLAPRQLPNSGPVF
jgi:hypothetical protein